MSLSSAMSTAVVGLTLTSKRADAVADNVANADRPGYARRSVTSTSNGPGLPPGRTAIDRAVDPRLVQLRREAEARAGHASVESGFQVAFDAALGDPDQPGSLQDRLAQLDAALVGAATNPSSEVALTQVAHAAADIANKIGEIAEVVVRERQAADTRIGTAVEQLNADLAEVERLNADIIRHGANDKAAADLLDRRTVVVDRISTQIPVRVLPRDNDAIALVSEGGQILLDGRPAEIEFTPSPFIVPGMVHPTNLSGLTINGRDLASHGASSTIGGGTLSALFDLRDEVAPDATAKLDGFAQELIARFSDPLVDPSLTATDPGLFTDAGGVLGAPVAPGLAGRLALNPAIDPSDASTLWRLRDGLAAVAPAPIAGAGTLAGFSSAIHGVATPTSPALSQTPGSLVGIAAALKSAVSSDRVRTESLAQETQAEANDRGDLRDGGGVDIDAEMQHLLRIEQTYAANARLIQAAGEMMDRLTEL
ncbi:MAG: flagellar basal body rod C-terminal domain-containing protein [Pseudomonadota bacterium]